MKGKTPTAPATDDREPDEHMPDDREPDEKVKDQETEEKHSKGQQSAATDDTSDDTSDDEEKTSPRSVGRLVLQLGPAVALLVVSVLLVMVWRENAGLSQDARTQRELTTSAGKVASTFFNWDHRHMDKSFAAKYPLLTKKAADTIRPTAGALTSYFTANQVGSQASISGVYPGDIKGDEARVVVVLNTRVTTAKSVQTNTGATLALNMKRVSGKWLADNITLLGSGVQSITDPNGRPLENGGGSGAPLPGGVAPGKPAP